jgi:two-component system LytT family response regulator
VCTAETSYTLRESLQALEARLDPRQFIRVHRSAMVRIDAVRMVERLPSDRIALVLDGGTRVPVSRARREVVMTTLAHVRG